MKHVDLTLNAKTDSVFPGVAPVGSACRFHASEIGSPLRPRCGLSARSLFRMNALWGIVGVITVLIWMAAALGDEAAKPASRLKFDIPQQSLVDALQAYSTRTGVQVMFESASAVGYRSSELRGEFMPEVALRMLLADTDLRIRYSRASAVTLARPSERDPDEPPAHALASADLSLDTLRVTSAPQSSDESRLGAYIGVVQGDIERALRKLAKTRRGDYRVAIKLWVDPSRAVERVELDGSTGDPDRDRSIAGALKELVLSEEAPANAPRPIRFMIAIRAP